MKGISTVIATILMLMITIALAGTAYLYISGAFQQQMQGIEVVDSFCSGGTQANIVLRNVGTSSISFQTGGTGDGCSETGNSGTCGSVSVTRTSGGGTVNFATDTASLAPGTTGTLTDSGCATTGNPVTCVYRIIPPSGRSVEATVFCTG